MKRAMLKSVPLLTVVLILATAFAILDGIVAIYTKDAIDAVFKGDQDAFRAVVYQLLLVATGMIPVAVLLAAARGYFKRSAIVSGKVHYVKSLFNKNINEFQQENNATYLSVVTNDMNTIETNYIDAVYEVVVNSVNFIVGVIVIGSVSPVILALGIVTGVISTLISLLINKPMQRQQAQRSELYSGFTAYIKEVLSAFHIIQANDLADKVKIDYYDKSKSIQLKGYIIDRMYTFIIALNRLNFSLVFLLVMGITVYMGIQGSMTIGGVILIVTNMEKVMQPLSQIGEFLPKIFSTKSIFNRIEDSLKNRNETVETVEIKEIQHQISFENVSFGFEEHQVLHQVNQTFKKGEKYLIVGPSGGGKSTLLRLLRKYFEPQEGRILVDGIELSKIYKASYFKHIANVDQQVFLFEDTLRNNLTLYKNYTDLQIHKALKGAGLQSFVQSIPGGLEAMLYENGKNISGGEKSRIAIARALLQEADIIFLDEAFASLDADTAKAIESTLLTLEGITIINVSHVVFEAHKPLYTQVLTVKNKGIQSLKVS